MGPDTCKQKLLRTRKNYKQHQTKKIELKPMFSPRGLNCTPVRDSWQNFLIFSLLDLHLGNPDLSASPHRDTGGPTPSWEL